MSKRRSRLVFSDTELQKSVIGFDEDVRRGMDAIFIRHSAIATQTLKNKAPWTDRTGNARAGLQALFARAGNRRRTWTLTMSHQVPYGVYLELKNSGKYAVIRPNLEPIGRAIMLDTARLFVLMGK